MIFMKHHLQVPQNWEQQHTSKPINNEPGMEECTKQYNKQEDNNSNSNHTISFQQNERM